MHFKDKPHSLPLFIGIIILSILVIWQGNISPFTLSRSDDEINIVSDGAVGSDFISTVSNRASFNYQQDLNVPFRWEEPLQGASKIQFSSGGYQTIQLGFTFPFYDEVYSSINLFTHGYASFTSTYSTSSNQRFPSADPSYAKIIAPLWEYVYYWYAGPNSGIYYKSLQNPERYVITWYQAPYDGSGGTCNYQIVLYKDNGNILFNYQRVSQRVRPTVGLNDGDGVHFNMPYYNNQRPGNTQSIVFGTMGNDVAMDRVLSPEPDTRVLPDREIYINATVINYGFNVRNNVPVELSITCDEDPGYLHSNSTVTSGNQGVMESQPISFRWTVPAQENRHYTLNLMTVLSSPPDEVQDGNELEFRITGKTFYDIGVWEVPRIKGEWYPFQKIPVTARIANWGNVDTNCSVKMTINGKHPRFMDAPVVRSGGVEGVIEPFIFNITYTWMVITPGKYTIAITTLLDNDERAGNNIKSVVKEVVVSPFDVRFAYNGSTLSGKPNSVVSFKLTVYNDGEKKDDIQLNVTEYPAEEGWSKPVFDHNVLRSMSRETSREVGLIVAIPPLAAAGLATIRIKALSLGDGNTNVTLGLLVNVLPDPKVSVLAPEGQSAFPGDTIRYNFTIRNKGNSADSFSISTTSTNNWNTKVLGSPITDELDPNSQDDNQTIQITTTVPDNSLYGSTDILKVTASSLEEINVQSSAHVSTAVLQHHDVKIKAAISEYAIHTERDVWISFNVTNTGNGKDDTISFDVGTPYGWYTYIDDSKLHGGLERLYWAQILMKVRVPRGTANDVFPLNVSTLAGEVPTVKDTFTFYFEILPEFGINISSTEPLKTSHGEKDVTFPLLVKNTGNTYEAFNVSSPSEWLRFSYEGMPLEDIWLRANETRTVKATMTIPPGIEADSDNSTHENDPHSFSIEAASSLNPKAIYDSTTIRLSITPGHDHVLFGQFASLKVARKPQEQSRDYQLYIENTGNVKDIIHLKMNMSSHGPISASVSPINVHLTHGQTKAVVLTLKVRPDADLGTYHLVIETASGGNDSIKRQLNLTVEVVDYDFRISVLSINDIELSSTSVLQLKRNHQITVSVLVGNIGSDRFEGVYGKNLSVAFYLGTTRIYSHKIGTLEKSEIKKISFEWKPKITGKLELIVNVNNNDEIPESVMDNNEVRAEIEVVSEDHGVGDDLGEESAPEIVYYIGIILIILLSGIIIFSLLFLLRKRNVREGYDEEGKYRPDIYRGRLERKEIAIDLDEWGDLYSEPEEETETAVDGYFIGTKEGLKPPVVRKKKEEGRTDRIPLPVEKKDSVSQALPVLSDGETSVPVTVIDMKSLPSAGMDTFIDDDPKEPRTIVTKPVTVPVMKLVERNEHASVTMKRITTKPVATISTILPKAKTVPVLRKTTESSEVPLKPLSMASKSSKSGDTVDANTETGTKPIPTQAPPVRVLTKPVPVGGIVKTFPVTTNKPVGGGNVEKSYLPVVEKKNDSETKTDSETKIIPKLIVTKPVTDSPGSGPGPVESTRPIKDSVSLLETAEEPENPPPPQESLDSDSSKSSKLPENSLNVTDAGASSSKKVSGDNEEIEKDLDDLLRDIEDLEM